METVSPLTLHSFPRAILHIDGDAFFASCEVAKNPRLKGKPVITGLEEGERGATAGEVRPKIRGETKRKHLAIPFLGEAV